MGEYLVLVKSLEKYTGEYKGKYTGEYTGEYTGAYLLLVKYLVKYPMNTHFTKEKPRKTQICKARPCARQFVSCKSSPILIKYMVTRGKSHKNTHSTGKTPRYPMNTHFTKEKPRKTQICKARPC